MRAHETEELDNSPRSRRIIQALMDLRGGDISGARILDLGSAHGLYTLECARRGATCLGLEGRAAWIEQAIAARDAQGLSKAHFEQADVRGLSSDQHGVFDVTLCLGLLYHLEADQAHSLIKTLYEMTNDFLILDTQFALSSLETRRIEGADFYGCTFPEHPPGTSPEDAEGNMGAALDGSTSFWFTLPSLFNILGDVGFSTVFQLQWPVDHLFKGGEFKLHEDYVTLVAKKGERVDQVLGTNSREGVLPHAPENPSDFFLDRPSREQVGWSNKRSIQPQAADKEGAAQPRATLRRRLKAAARALRG